jgi:hypothetical protein
MSSSLDFRVSPIAVVSACSGPAPASAESLAATMQAVDGDGYGSFVDAVVWPTLSAVIAQFLSTSSVVDADEDCCS